MVRLLKEACAYSNLHHPAEEKVLWDSSPWPLLYGAVHAYLRHSHTPYTEALAGGAEREVLREQIGRAAATAYPWLRIERDPRTEQVSVSASHGTERPYNNFSRELSSLVEVRARLTETIKVERRKRTPNWRERLAEAEGRLAKVNARIEKLTGYFDTSVQRDEQGKGIWVKPLCHVHSRAGEYDFAGHGDLPPNYTRSAGFKCPQCEASVLRTKVPIPVGAGKKQLAFSCHCLSVMIEPGFGRRVNPEHWRSALGDTNKEAGNIVLLDEQGILYGHRLLAEIAEDQQARAIKIYRDIKPAAFFGFLEVHFGSAPAVVALRNKESVSNEDLERISREVVLSVEDAEQILAAQERAEALGEDF
jgi:hypothetical protein